MQLHYYIVQGTLRSLWSWTVAFTITQLLSHVTNKLWCDPNWNHLTEAISMSGHNIEFSWEIIQIALLILFNFWALSVALIVYVEKCTWCVRIFLYLDKHPLYSDDIVLAQYSIDKEWYRARIKNVLNEDPGADLDEVNVEVVYIDYGNKEVQMASRSVLILQLLFAC